MRALFVLLALAALAVAPVAAQQKPAAPKSSAAKNAPTASAPLNINTATSAQLETLPGLGKAVAERIVEYRDKNGNFKKIEEMLETARSCPSLLSILTFGSLRSVSGSRQKSQ